MGVPVSTCPYPTPPVPISMEGPRRLGPPFPASPHLLPFFSPPSFPRRCCGGFWGAGEGGLCPPFPPPGQPPTKRRLTWPGSAPKPSPPSTTSPPSTSPPRRWDPGGQGRGRGGETGTSPESGRGPQNLGGGGEPWCLWGDPGRGPHCWQEPGAPELWRIWERTRGDPGVWGASPHPGDIPPPLLCPPPPQ